MQCVSRLRLPSKIDLLVFYSTEAYEDLGISEQQLMNNIAVAFLQSTKTMTDASGIPLQFNLVRIQKVSAGSNGHDHRRCAAQ